jgi:hypothetical protein
MPGSEEDGTMKDQSPGKRLLNYFRCLLSITGEAVGESPRKAQWQQQNVCNNVPVTFLVKDSGREGLMRKLLLALILLCVPSIAWCDEYVLVMSKDDDVCLHMSQIFNNDLKKHDEIQFGKHPEFTAIKWQQKRRYRIDEKGAKKYGGSSGSYGGVLMSTFDINNDGKEEIVLWSRDRGLRSTPSDQIYVFTKEEAALFKDGIEDIPDNYRNAIGILGGALGREPFPGNGYSLKEIPPAEIAPKLGQRRNVKIYHGLGGWFYFNPFLYKGMYYVTMTDWDPPVTKQWLVILKYTPENQVKDICYYLKAVVSKKTSPEGR